MGRISTNTRFAVDCDEKLVTITRRAAFCVWDLDEGSEVVQAVMDIFERNWGGGRESPFRPGECTVRFVLEPCSNREQEGRARLMGQGRRGCFGFLSPGGRG